MIITCQQCETRLTIPDHKVPENKDAAVKCPKCRAKIFIHTAVSGSSNSEIREAQPSPMSFQDRQSAMLCIESNDIRKRVQPLLRQMGFNIEVASNGRTALSKMEYHVYHLVLIDESFDEKKGLLEVVERMNNIDMSLRRRICLLLVSQKFRTNDYMAALHSSVNGILRVEDLVHMDAFLLRFLAEHKQFYTVYNESLKHAGKA